MVNKIMWVGASSGGHMTQLLTLLEYSQDWSIKPTVFITTNNVMVEKLKRYGEAKNIGECNRKSLIDIIAVMVKSLSIILNINKNNKPDVILTTGSLPLAIFCHIARLRGAKIIWIDSIANVDDISMSGKMMRPFVDLFIVQWDELLSKYSNIEYVGEII